MKDVYDVVVVGAGGAGMTAALAAARQGLDTVLVEKSNYFGGSTARSGGGVWIPGNYALQAAGEADDPEESKRYLEAIVGDVVPKVRRDTFVDRGPEVMDFVRDQTPVRFAWVPEYSDYLPESPGGRARGRSVEPIPMDCRFLGEGAAHLHPPEGLPSPRRGAGPPAPPVKPGAGQPDRPPGQLPQDQPRHAPHPRPGHHG